MFIFPVVIANLNICTFKVVSLLGACTVHCRLSSSLTREIAASSTLQSITDDSERSPDGLQWNAVSLAKQALSASKQAAAVAEESKLIEADDDDNDDSLPFGLVLLSWSTLTSLISFCVFIG